MKEILNLISFYIYLQIIHISKIHYFKFINK